MKEQKGKHLTYDERMEIQGCLAKGVTFKDIGKRIGKDQTTVSKEVKRHIKLYTNSFVTRKDICPKLLKAPFVCNGCKDKSRSCCHYPRQVYEAKPAQSDYEALLSEAREGIALSKKSFYHTDAILTDAVHRGQHLYHAIKANNLGIPLSTVYRYIHKGYYSIASIDLPRAVKFKPRHPRNPEYVPKCVKNGRTYAEFQEYCSDNNISTYVELDTVIGRIGGKVIMTLHFTAFNFMIGLLLENKTSGEVAAKLQQLKNTLKEYGFSFYDLFPVILTDNGGEFSCVKDIEDNDSDQPSKLFFCEPNMPSEKPRIEKNHTLFRDILPKGSSFDSFTQATVNLIFSHVNAVKRKSFYGKSAYDLFCFSFSEKLASALGISFISPTDVVQSPLLLRAVK